jgi:ABC-type Na+ transport system ATPase subunit NatA
VIVLRAVDAGFSRDDLIVEAFSFTLRAGESARVVQPNARAASIAARICAAIVKPSTGTVFVGEYETRLQPPEAKRRVGFVDAAGFEGDEHGFRCEVAFRADVWNLDRNGAQERARHVLAALGDDAYARALALALVADVACVVLDQPPAGVFERVRRFVPLAGIVHTQAVLVPALPEPAVLSPAVT